MAKSEQRRQKQLLAKRARRKNRQLKATRDSNIGNRLIAAANWPCRAALVASGTHSGMWQAVIVREAPNGVSAYAVFLIDMFCQGVKKVIVNVSPAQDSRAMLEKLQTSPVTWTNVTPAYIRKLVEGAIGYSLSLGIKPHFECALALPLLANANPDECPEVFEFGKNGRPLLIPGPHDSPARIQWLVDTLTQSCGEGNFDYFIPMESSFTDDQWVIEAPTDGDDADNASDE